LGNAVSDFLVNIAKISRHYRVRLLSRSEILGTLSVPYKFSWFGIPEMRAIRPIVISIATAIAALQIAMPQLSCAVAGEAAQEPRSLVIAQAPMGSHHSHGPSLAPAAPLPPPKSDYIPPSLNPSQSAPDEPSPSSEVSWGAIGFTADGSYSSIWKMPSKAEAEAEVAKKCAAFGRGGCQVVNFSGRQCAALATFIGSYRRRRWDLSFTAGGETYPEAQNAAMTRCNSDERSQGRCQLRTAACADGR
jgi:hypothetical protein